MTFSSRPFPPVRKTLYVAMTRAKQQLFLPLEWKKSYLGKSGCLTKCSAMILPEGKLPVYLVQSVSSMAQWIWMCLFLRHDAELADACNFPPQYWKTPAWSENLQIAYEFKLPEETETEELQAEVTAPPDEETLERNGVQRSIPFSSTPISGKRKLMFLRKSSGCKHTVF